MSERVYVLSVQFMVERRLKEETRKHKIAPGNTDGSVQTLSKENEKTVEKCICLHNRNLGNKLFSLASSEGSLLISTQFVGI